MLLIPALDVFAKLLGQTLDPVEVTFMRFVVQTLLMAPLVIWTHQWQVPVGTLGRQFARGVLLAIATVCFLPPFSICQWPKRSLFTLSNR